MSNETQFSLFAGSDALEIRGIHRHHTRAKVIVHSHIKASPPIGSNTAGTVDCSNDCIAINTDKTIKGGGSASITLVPRHNYLNYIFPNDWVNVWINPGDGRGWIRVFFGFVDRVERSIQTSDPGTTTTQFNVSCSDFSKAFDVTNIYFNPHIAKRKDFIGNFAGTKNLAGAQLRTKGITAFGGPADIVLNFAHLLMGFGSQFVAPPTYPFIGALTEESRRWRREWAKSNLDEDIRKAIGGSTIKEWVKEIEADAKAIEAELKKDDNLTNSTYLYDAYTEEEIKNLREEWKKEDITDLRKQIAIALALAKRNLNKDVLTDPEVKTGLAVEETALGKGHLLDLIDFSFVEYAAIDGSIVSAPIWTQQGSLLSLMQSYSNDIVNELFFDLRPLGKNSKEFALVKGGYKREADEHHSFHDDFGVRFVPALIMREYPFSTIKALDVSKVKILGQYAKQTFFGAIFSQEPNVPGRKVVTIPALNDYLRIRKPGSSAFKHLDVAVISVTDIITENIGRSDADVVNLMEVFSDGGIGKHMKFSMKDVQPIANPVSVARHGLRVREYTTRFARFSKKQTNAASIDNFQTRNKLLRWVLMLDHWYQHNLEYLNGSITTREFPEIRVGYRLDIQERNESYYVEGASHSWQYPGGMTSTFTLSRGQRNDPFPVYEKVPLPTFGGDRKTNSRLADVFRQRDPSAVLRALQEIPSSMFSEITGDGNNAVDNPLCQAWGRDEGSYLAANSDEPFMGELIDTYKKIESLGELFDPTGKFTSAVTSEVSQLLDLVASLKKKTGGKSSIGGSTPRGNKS